MRHKMIKHRRDYSIYCRPEVANGIVLRCDVGCYVMVNFEVASCSIFHDNQEKNLDAEDSGGASAKRYLQPTGSSQ